MRVLRPIWPIALWVWSVRWRVGAKISARTLPWGPAINFDGPESDGVRRYFLENARYWQTECHLDALRLDAVHAIRDFSAVTFLEELAAAAPEWAASAGRPFHLIAESDLNMARHVLPLAAGGYGLDAQWSDDFHHALHVLLTGEHDGYYADFAGAASFAKAWRKGYVYTGEYSRCRRRRHGSCPDRIGCRQLVVCSQNHDQIGNRRLGDRLSATLSLERQKLAAGAVLLSPFIPLLFMGEEYGETAPFQFFVSHADPALIEAVRQGRREEFAAFGWQGDIPDPQDEATFRRCRLDHGAAREGPARALRAWYRELLRLRRQTPAIACVEKESIQVGIFEAEEALWARHGHGKDEVLVLFNFSKEQQRLNVSISGGTWDLRLDSAARRWQGPGSLATGRLDGAGSVAVDVQPASLALYQKLPSD